MVFYLKHDIHGTKVACSEIERAEDIKNGWKEFDPYKKEEVKKDTKWKK